MSTPNVGINVRSYTIEKSIRDAQDRIDGQLVIELCNQRTDNSLVKVNLDDLGNEVQRQEMLHDDHS